MGARAGDQSPWEQAVGRLRAELVNLPGLVTVKLALCGEKVEVSGELSEEVLARLEEEEPPSAVGRISFEELAAGLRDEDNAVWTLTDGLGPSRPPRVGPLTMLGGPVDNIGLIHGELTDLWPLPELHIEFDVASFASTTQQVLVAVEGPVESIAPLSLELPPGARRRAALELRRTGAGRLRLFLESEGNWLQADDELAWQLPGPPAPAIAVLAEEESGPWIHAAARALAEESGGTVVEGVPAAGFLLVEGGVMEMEPGRRRALYFGTRPPGAPLEPRSVWSEAVVVDWDRQDPLTAGLDLSDLRIDHALSGILPPGKPLILGERGPLMVLVEGVDRATIHTAFRMSDSNIGLLSAFPQLLRRSLSRAYGQPARPRALAPRLLSPAESDLRGGGLRPRDRPLPTFGRPGTSLVVLLLLLALLAMALRVYT